MTAAGSCFPLKSDYGGDRVNLKTGGEVVDPEGDDRILVQRPRNGYGGSADRY